MKVVHWLPGRVRLEIPELYRHPETVLRLEGLLLLQRGVIKAKANPVTGRMLICYAPDLITLVLLKREISRILQLPPEVRKNLRSSHQIRRKELELYELEKLPLAQQFGLTAITSLLLLFSLKGKVNGPKPHGRGAYLLKANEILTALTSVPICRSAVEHLLNKGCLCTELVAGTVTVGSLFVEESRLGLFVSWLVYLNTLIGTVVQESIRDRIRGMLEGKKPIARLVTRQGKLIVPGDQVAQGSRLEVRPGEAIPVDGIIEAGNGLVNRMPIQGCRKLLAVAPGETVYAGSVLVGGAIRVKTLRVGQQSYIGQVIKKLGEDEKFFNVPVNRILNRLSLTSLLAAGGYYVFSRNLGGALKLLIVGMPGAAGLAQTLPAEMASVRAAKSGVLVKRGSNLGKLGDADLILIEPDSLLTGQNRLTRVTINQLRRLNYNLQYLPQADEHCPDVSKTGKFVRYIQKLHRQGHNVGMIGKSNGDTPPLSAADVGITLASSDDLHLKSADIIIATEDPRALARLAVLARSTRRIAWQNLRLSMGSSLIGLGLGFCNFLPAFMAGAIQNFSTIAILANSSRLLLGELKDNGYRLNDSVHESPE